VLTKTDPRTPKRIAKRVRYVAALAFAGLALASRSNAQSGATASSSGLYSILGFLPIILIFGIIGLVWWLSRRSNRGTVDRYLAERAKGPASPPVSATSGKAPAQTHTEVNSLSSSGSAPQSKALSQTRPRAHAELRSYDAKAPCPACGVVGAKTRFKRAGGAFDPSTGRSADVMLRTCGNCGYKWKERALGD